MTRKSYIPEGYQAIMPSLAFKGTDAAITWYKNVFGAKEKMRMDGPDKKVMHKRYLRARVSYLTISWAL